MALWFLPGFFGYGEETNDLTFSRSIDVPNGSFNRCFYSRVENAEDAEDLTGQTFMSIIEALPRYQHRGPFTAWVFQIARSRVMDFFRRNPSRVREEADVDGRVFDDRLEKVIQGRTIQRLQLNIQLLDEDERELLRLRFVPDLCWSVRAFIDWWRPMAKRRSARRNPIAPTSSSWTSSCRA